MDGCPGGVRRTLKKAWYALCADRPYAYIGRLIVRILPQSFQVRVRDEFFTARGPTGMFADIVRAEVNRRHYSADTEEVRRHAREFFWGSTPGKRWHDLGKERFRDVDAYNREFLGPRRPLIRHLSDLLTTTEEYRTICEIGTGNGMFLCALSEEFPSIRRFIGMDFNKEQILENQVAYKNSCLEFLHGEVRDWIQSECVDGTIFVGCETFEFFTRKELEELFRLVRQTVKPAAIAIFALVESGSLGNGVSQPRGSLAFSHDYPYLLARCCYQIFGLKIQRGFPYDQVSVLAVASSGGG